MLMNAMNDFKDMFFHLYLVKDNSYEDMYLMLS